MLPFFCGTNMEVAEQVKSIVSNVVSLGWVKVSVSFLVMPFAWLFDDGEGALPAVIVAVLIALDSISGMLAAVRSGEGLSSRKAKRICWKFIIYGLGIITGRLLDKVVPNPCFAVIIETFLALTEGQSIIENLGRAGMPIPKKLANLFSQLKK